MRKRTFAALAALVALVVTNGSAEQAALGAPGIVVLQEGQPVTIDDFRVVGSGAPPKQPTRATVSWDSTALQVIFDCTDDAIGAAQTNRDAISLWKDDSVYVWLDAGHTHSSTGSIIMVQVSAGGTVFDTRNNDIKFNVTGLAADVTRTDKGWRAVIRLPWKGLEVPRPKPGEVWGMNLTRIDQAAKYDYHHMETSSWSDLPGGRMTVLRHWRHVVFSAAAGDGTVPAATQAAIDKTHLASQPSGLVEDDGFSWGVPMGPDWFELLGVVEGFPGSVSLASAKDLKVTTTPEGKTLQGTIVVGGVPVSVAERATLEPNGVARFDLDVAGAGVTGGNSNKLAAVFYTLKIPAARFAKGAFEADEKRGAIPAAYDPAAQKISSGKIGSLSLKDPDQKLTLRVELSPAAQVDVEDIRKWEPNLCVRILVRPGDLPPAEKASLTIRLKATTAP